MAVQVQVAGLVTVKVDSGAANALETLGYTRNGAEITLEGFYLNVPGDEFGGDDGPPVDVQWLGEIARIRLQLTKWDQAIADKVLPRDYGGVLGTPSAPGILFFGGANTFRLVLDAGTDNNYDFNFPRAILRGAVEINTGTKFSELVLEFEAHENAAGVLWNRIMT